MTTITTRAGKGSPLTNTELDNNFTNLNTDKLETSGGSMTGNLSFGDSSKAIFGAGSDLQIYHDGSQSYIVDNGQGNLNLYGANVILGDLSGSKYFEAQNDGQSIIYANGSQKLATTSTGVDVTGTITSDGLTVSGSLLNTAAGQFTNTDTANGNGLFVRGGGSNAGKYSALFQSGAGATTLRVASNGDISFYETDGSTASFVYDADAGTTFNEAGNDRDFRVESDNDVNCFVVNAGTDRVSIGNSNPAGKFEIFGANAGDIMMRINNSAYGSTDTSGENKLQFGWINHTGASIVAYKDGTVNRTGFKINTEVGFNTETERLVLGSNGSLTLTPDNSGDVVFNENSVNADFRVESDSNANMLFVDAGNNRVSIGSSATYGSLNVDRPGHLSGYGNVRSRPVNNAERFYSAFQAVPSGSDFNSKGGLHIGSNVASDGLIVTGAYYYNSGYYMPTATAASGISISGSITRFYANSGLTVGTTYVPSNRFQISGAEVTVNEISADLDFRVESDSTDHMLFVDAGNDSVGVRNSNPSAISGNVVGSTSNFTVSGTAGSTQIADTGNSISFSRGSANYISAINSGADIIIDTADSLLIRDYDVGTSSTSARISSTGTAVTINNDSVDVDFRVESDSNSNAILVNAGTDQVGLFTASLSSRAKVVIADTAAYDYVQPDGRMLWVGSDTSGAGTRASVIIGRGTYGGGGNQYATIGLHPSHGNEGFTTGFDLEVERGTEGTAHAGFSIVRSRRGASSTRALNTPFKIAASGSPEVVINDDSTSYTDFRVESDSNTHMLFVDAGNNSVGFGTNSPAGNVQIYTGSAGTVFNVNHGTGGSYPKASGIGLGATSTSLTVSSNGGTVSFLGGAGIYAENTASSGNPTNLVFWTNLAGTPSESARIDKSAFSTFQGSAIFNEAGKDQDFRVESDSEANMLFVNAGTNRVGINTADTSLLGDLVVRGDGSYSSGNGVNAIFYANSGGRGTTRVRSVGNDAAERIWDVNGALRWIQSCRPSGDALPYSMKWYAQSASPSLGTVGSAVMSLSQSGNLNVSGSLSKGSGSFKIKHPLPEKNATHDLVHSFVEAPQADNIYRGKVDLVAGQATVNIDTVAGMTDGTFAALNREVQCFTSNETGWTAVRGSVSGNILTIEAQDNTCADTISWLVVGERQDIHMYDTEWTDENGKVIVEPLRPDGSDDPS